MSVVIHPTGPLRRHLTSADLAVHVGIVAAALITVAPALLLRAEAGGIGTVICLCGAALTVAFATVAYHLQRAQGRVASLAPPLTLRDWFLQRGILYVLSQAPVAAIFAGFFFRLIPFGLAAIFVIISFFALFVWASYRRAHSTSQDEPAHHLHRYALYAIVPCVMFSVARIPTHLGFGFAYWHPWYDFGNELTRLPLNEYSSLAAGALLYTLDGLVLAIGYYILFQRHSLLNAVVYICLYISAIYCFTFPAFARVGMPSPPRWHAVVYWAHFAMAVAAWYTPRFFKHTWPSLRLRGHAVTGLVLGALIAAPYSYAAIQAKRFQWPKQHRLDEELFSRPNLLTPGADVTVSDGPTGAEYELSLRFGPRLYKNWVNRMRVLDARDLSVKGSLEHDGETIAWCEAQLAEVESPNERANEPEFPQLARAADRTDVRVHCVGPSSDALALTDGARLQLHWSARATLVGDRESQDARFEGVTGIAVRGASGLSRPPEQVAAPEAAAAPPPRARKPAAPSRVKAKALHAPQSRKPLPKARRSRLPRVALAAAPAPAPEPDVSTGLAVVALEPPTAAAVAPAAPITAAPAAVAAVEVKPAAPQRPFVTHVNFGVVAVNAVAATAAAPGKTVTLKDRQTLVQNVGFGYFVAKGLRVMLSFQFAEVAGGAVAGSSPFAMMSVQPWLAWHPIGPLFVGAGAIVAARNYGVDQLDLGVFASVGASVPLGAGFALGAAVQVPVMLKVKIAVSAVPAVSLSYRF